MSTEVSRDRLWTNERPAAVYLGVAAPRVRAVVLSSVSARYFSSSSRHTPSKYLLSSLISRSCWARILTTNQRSVLTVWTNQRPVLPGHLLPVLRPQRLRSVARLVCRSRVHVGVRYLVLRLVNILLMNIVMLRQKFRQGLATKRPLKATERP